MPFSAPDEEPIVAIAVLLLSHVPPAVALLNAADAPIQTVVVPEIGAGKGSTVIVFVVAQPVVNNVKVMVAVPVATPINTPVLFIVAIAVLLLLHMPKPVPESVVVIPGQTFEAPVIGDGRGFTVTVVATLHVPPSE